MTERQNDFIAVVRVRARRKRYNQRRTLREGRSHSYRRYGRISRRMHRRRRQRLDGRFYGNDRERTHADLAAGILGSDGQRRERLFV